MGVNRLILFVREPIVLEVHGMCEQGVFVSAFCHFFISSQKI
jgi:hypothetical protein